MSSVGRAQSVLAASFWSFFNYKFMSVHDVLLIVAVCFCIFLMFVHEMLDMLCFLGTWFNGRRDFLYHAPESTVQVWVLTSMPLPPYLSLAMCTCTPGWRISFQEWHSFVPWRAAVVSGKIVGSELWVVFSTFLCQFRQLSGIGTFESYSIGTSVASIGSQDKTVPVSP